jgi:hypothetical protein
MSRSVFINDSKSNRMFRHASSAAQPSEHGRSTLGGVAGQTTYRVMRDRFFSKQPACELLVGDLVFLGQGDRCPADVVVVCSAHSLPPTSERLSSIDDQSSTQPFFWIDSCFIDGSPVPQLRHAAAQHEIELLIDAIRSAQHTRSSSFVVPPTPSGISAREAWLVEWIQASSVLRGTLDCDQPAGDIEAFDGKLTLRFPFPIRSSVHANPHHRRPRHRNGTAMRSPCVSPLHADAIHSSNHELGADDTLWSTLTSADESNDNDDEAQQATDTRDSSRLSGGAISDTEQPTRADHSGDGQQQDDQDQEDESECNHLVSIREFVPLGATVWSSGMLIGLVVYCGKDTKAAMHSCHHFTASKLKGRIGRTQRLLNRMYLSIGRSLSCSKSLTVALLQELEIRSRLLITPSCYWISIKHNRQRSIAMQSSRVPIMMMHNCHRYRHE